MAPKVSPALAQSSRGPSFKTADGRRVRELEQRACAMTFLFEDWHPGKRKPRWEKKIVAVRVAHCWHQARQWRKQAEDRGHYGYLPQMCNGARHVEVLVETTTPITGRTASTVAERITDPMMERGEWPGENWPASCEACKALSTPRPISAEVR
jgi:hypothetical protein